MAENKLKEYRQLNQHFTQALSKQMEGSPTERDQILLQTHAKLLDVMKELFKESNVQPLFHLQTEISRIVASEEIDIEEVFRFHQLVSKAMRSNSIRETLILVNMELSRAMMDGSQEGIRNKLLCILRLLSKGMIDCAGNEDVEALFKLNESLSQAIDEKSEDKKLDLLVDSNLRLAEFMAAPAAGFLDTETSWLIQLNRLVGLALVQKKKIPTFLQDSIHVLSREIRKIEDEAICKDAMDLIYTLSSMLVEDDTGSSFFNQLATWKIQLSNIMEELMGEGSNEAMKQAREENIAAQNAALQVENRKLRDKLEELIQARDSTREEARKSEVEELELSRAEKDGGGTRSGGAKNPKFSSKYGRSLNSGKKNPMHEVYLPPVNPNRGNKGGASPRFVAIASF